MKRRDAGEHGIALAVTLALLFVLALLLVQALGGAIGATALAANLQFRQVAFEAAEGGLVAGRRLLLTTPAVAPPPLEQASGNASAGRAGTLFTHRGDAPPPPGYSLDRFIVRHVELRSTGSAARGARIVLVEGVDRLDLR